jgi:hypothetical protein
MCPTTTSGYVRWMSPTNVTAKHSPLSRFFRSPDSGDIVVFQMPNIPLWIFLAATAARLLFKPHGAVGTCVSIIGTLSLVVWGVLEVTRGDSPFRRVLGGAVLLAIAVGMFTR